MSYIPLKPVESSMIKAIGYDRKKQTLRVMFSNGDAYDYPTFSDRDWATLNEAASLGKHFSKYIRPMFGHRKVTEAQLKEPCCDHPSRDTCDDSCGPCDEQCCPPSLREFLEGWTPLQLLGKVQELIGVTDAKALVAVSSDLKETLDILHARLEQNLVPDEGVSSTGANVGLRIGGNCGLLLGQGTCEHVNTDATMDEKHVVCTDCGLEKGDNDGTED